MAESYRIKIDTSNTDRLIKELAQIEKLEGTVGVKAGATYPNGMPISKVAMYLEYGWVKPVTKRQQGWFWAQGFHVQNILRMPPRPTFSFTAKKYHKKWERIGQKILSSPQFSISPLETATRALGLACAEAQADVQNTINTNGEGTFAPRSSLTLALYAIQMQGHESKKGKNVSEINTSETTKALNHIGLFLKSISYEIKGA